MNECVQCLIFVPRVHSSYHVTFYDFKCSDPSRSQERLLIAYRKSRNALFLGRTALRTFGKNLQQSPL